MVEELTAVTPAILDVLSILKAAYPLPEFRDPVATEAWLHGLDRPIANLIAELMPAATLKGDLGKFGDGVLLAKLLELAKMIIPILLPLLLKEKE